MTISKYMVVFSLLQQWTFSRGAYAGIVWIVYRACRLKHSFYDPSCKLYLFFKQRRLSLAWRTQSPKAEWESLQSQIESTQFQLSSCLWYLRRKNPQTKLLNCRIVKIERHWQWFRAKNDFCDIPLVCDDRQIIIINLFFLSWMPLLKFNHKHFQQCACCGKDNKKLFQSLKIAQKRNLSLYVSNVIC